MKKILILLVCILCGVSGQVVFAASISSTTMQQYIRTYCSRTNPVQNCGRYDDAIEEATSRAEIFTRMFQRYDSVKRNMITQFMLEEFDEIFRLSRSIEDKLVAAYYYDYFSYGFTTTDADVKKYVADLFGDRNYNYDYDDRYYTTDDAGIVSVR
jgi:hypothetical protein